MAQTTDFIDYRFLNPDLQSDKYWFETSHFTNNYGEIILKEIETNNYVHGRKVNKENYKDVFQQFVTNLYFNFPYFLEKDPYLQLNPSFFDEENTISYAGVDSLIGSKVTSRRGNAFTLALEGKITELTLRGKRSNNQPNENTTKYLKLSFSGSEDSKVITSLGGRVLDNRDFRDHSPQGSKTHSFYIDATEFTDIDLVHFKIETNDETFKVGVPQLIYKRNWIAPNYSNEKTEFILSKEIIATSGEELSSSLNQFIKGHLYASDINKVNGQVQYAGDSASITFWLEEALREKQYGLMLELDSRGALLVQKKEDNGNQLKTISNLISKKENRIFISACGQALNRGLDLSFKTKLKTFNIKAIEIRMLNDDKTCSI